MSSRSPRGSFSGVSSADVAADFEDSLKDLGANNRYEISNLTIIAKESTEHAEAISNVLENHIKNTSPSRKLPALYVLDSIVKNVGTPYSFYLGRNLFRTFMDAYVLVDSATRRNMEGMLKTWKEPVPGSIDSRPVFPPENVRPIDNALIKAKTAAIQNQRQAQPSQVAYRGTATPPQHNGQFAPPQNQPHQQLYGGLHNQQVPQQHTYAAMGNQPSSELEILKRDISLLISRDRHMVSLNPADIGLQTRLQALSDLRNLLDMRSFVPNELQAIRAQVQQIAPSAPGPPQSSTPQPPPQWAQSSSAPQPYQAPQPTFPTAISQPNIPAPPVLNPAALSGLQALLANVPKPSTPQLRAALPEMRSASHSQLDAIQHHTAVAPAASGAADLLSSLAKAGLIKPTINVTKPSSNTVPNLSQGQTAMLLKSLQGVLPPSGQGILPMAMPAQRIAAKVHVPVSAASLKIYRPEIISSLYDAQPNQCSTCGRRFEMTGVGREEKSRHLDWHFRTNQRMADPNLNRGHHRNWYVDELEWVRHVEFDPSTAATGAGEVDTATKPNKQAAEQFVRAPPGMTKNTCNICFEEMKSSYSEDQQDWIFADATLSNGKIVHAQCHAEMSKSLPSTGGGALSGIFSNNNAGARERSATPDSTLGKRKAESAMVGNGARLKLSQ